jgi:hypothetical protein
MAERHKLSLAPCHPHRAAASNSRLFQHEHFSYGIIGGYSGYGPGSAVSDYDNIRLFIPRSTKEVPFSFDIFHVVFSKDTSTNSSDFYEIPSKTLVASR